MILIVIANAAKLDEDLRQCREILRKTNEDAGALRKQFEGIYI